MSKDFDDWIKIMMSSKGCTTCRHKPAAETIRQLLRAMIKHGATHITLLDIATKTQATHKTYTIGVSGLRTHLNICEKKLYRKARGYDE